MTDCKIGSHDDLFNNKERELIMAKKRDQNQIYTHELMDLVLEIGYPEYPGRTEDLAAVKEFAKKFGVTPEKVANDIPQAAYNIWRKPTKQDRTFNLLDDFD